MQTYAGRLQAHYRKNWLSQPRVLDSKGGRRWALPPEFRVLEFPPRSERNLWTYATCGMSLPNDEAPLELHLFSPEQHFPHVGLLAAIADYHQTGAHLGLAHSVNFGVPWLPGSLCAYGLISLPYLDGPAIEFCETERAPTIRCLWLVPITEQEREFKRANGQEALEQLFESTGFNYANPMRPSVV